MSQKKNEGILFPTEIRVVGSYTDRLLMFEFWREATATSVPGLLCQSGRRRPENVSILSSLFRCLWDVPRVGVFDHLNGP